MQFIIDGSGSNGGADGNGGFVAGEREADPASLGRQTGKKRIAVRALGRPSPRSRSALENPDADPVLVHDESFMKDRDQRHP
jgi:hypothetical protein